MPLDQFRFSSTHSGSREREVTERFVSLKKKSKLDLQQIVKRYSKVVDVREVPKAWLISDILEAEFGKGYSKYL